MKSSPEYAAAVEQATHGRFILSRSGVASGKRAVFCLRGDYEDREGIDVSAAFIQSIKFDPDAPPRYCV